MKKVLLIAAVLVIGLFTFTSCESELEELKIDNTKEFGGTESDGPIVED